MKLFKCAVILSSLVASQAASASVVFGVYGASTASAATDVTASGNTAKVLTGVAATNLSGIDVLWLLNASYSTLNANKAAIASFVDAGGVLIVNDRTVTGANGFLPGGSGITTVSGYTANIDVADTTTAVTAGLTNSSLDGGNYSAHGYAVLSSLPTGGISVLNNGIAADSVDSLYQYGRGYVYYSTVPLDYYLGNIANPAAFRTTYAPNLVREGVALTDAVTGAVPEPATWAMMILGLGAVGFAMRRSKSAAATGRGVEGAFA